MTDEKRQEGADLWKRYTEAWEAEQPPPAKGLGTPTEPIKCPSCRGSGESRALKAGPPGPCRVCGGTGVMKP